MLFEHLFSFAVVIVSQLLFFIFHAWSVGELSNAPKYLIQGGVLGLPFGIASDLLVGHQLNIWSYELGWPLWFLTINGVFSYGFMIANVILLYKHSFLNMLVWVLGVGIVYEVTNHFFRVWNWEYLPFSTVQHFILFAFYVLLTWGIMVSLRIVFKYRFRLVPF